MIARILVGLIVIAGLGFVTFTFQVDERKYALKFHLGVLEKADYEPGLHFKVPFWNNVKYLDRRILTIDSDPERFITSEKKDLLIDYYVKWQIIDPIEFYKAAQGSELRGTNLLGKRIQSALKDQVAIHTIQEVIDKKREEILQNVIARAGEEALKLGIRIEDVRVKRIDFPSNLLERVYVRMRSERSKVARDFRAKGKAEGEEIRAKADADSVIIRAKEYSISEKTRGDGDAQAAAIYAEAFGKDPEFYRFYRSLNAYESTFANKQDVIVLQPDNDFFKYFQSSDATK